MIFILILTANSVPRHPLLQTRPTQQVWPTRMQSARTQEPAIVPLESVIVSKGKSLLNTLVTCDMIRSL